MPLWPFGKRSERGGSSSKANHSRTSTQHGISGRPSTDAPLPRASAQAQAYLDGRRGPNGMAHFVDAVDMDSHLRTFSRSHPKNRPEPRDPPRDETRKEAIERCKGQDLHPRALPPPDEPETPGFAGRTWKALQPLLPNRHQLRHPQLWKGFRRGPPEPDVPEPEITFHPTIWQQPGNEQFRNWLIGQQNGGDGIGEPEVRPCDSISIVRSEAWDSDEDFEDDLPREPEIIDYPSDEDSEAHERQAVGPLPIIPSTEPFNLGEEWDVGEDGVPVPQEGQRHCEPEQPVEKAPQVMGSIDEFLAFQVGNAPNPDPTQPPYAPDSEEGLRRLHYIREVLGMPRDTPFVEVRQYLVRNCELINHAERGTIPLLDESLLREHGQPYQRPFNGESIHLFQDFYHSVNEIFWDEDHITMTLEAIHLGKRDGNAEWFVANEMKKSRQGRMPLEAARRRLVEDELYAANKLKEHEKKVASRRRRPNTLLSQLVQQQDQTEEAEGESSQHDHQDESEMGKSVFEQGSGNTEDETKDVQDGKSEHEPKEHEEQPEEALEDESDEDESDDESLRLNRFQRY